MQYEGSEEGIEEIWEIWESEIEEKREGWTTYLAYLDSLVICFVYECFDALKYIGMSQPSYDNKRTEK